jgi:hypothetical protein
VADFSKSSTTSIRLDKATEGLAKELGKAHLAGSFSSYIKGLIALDGLLTKGPLDVTQVPTWMLVAFKLDVINGKVQPLKIARR